MRYKRSRKDDPIHVFKNVTIYTHICLYKHLENLLAAVMGEAEIMVGGLSLSLYLYRL